MTRARALGGAVVAIAAVILASCGGDTSERSTPGSGSPASPSDAAAGGADIGGYELAYSCLGEGSPTVLLEAGLGGPGLDVWDELLPMVAASGAHVCTYDRAGVGVSDSRPSGDGRPTSATQAGELHALLEAIGVSPPYVLVPHSYGGLVARMFADRYPDEVAGFVFEDVSTAWEIDLWPRWDPSPWIDGRQTIDIDTTERLVLHAEALGPRPTIVLSQSRYDEDEEGIPPWAGPIFARQQAKLAALGDDVIHVRAEDTGHFIHWERPELVVTAIAEVVRAVSTGTPLAPCEEVFDDPVATCL